MGHMMYAHNVESNKRVNNMISTIICMAIAFWISSLVILAIVLGTTWGEFDIVNHYLKYPMFSYDSIDELKLRKQKAAKQLIWAFWAFVFAPIYFPYFLIKTIIKEVINLRKIANGK